MTLGSLAAIALPWLLIALVVLVAVGVALTTTLPGLTYRNELWHKPPILPLVAFMGALDLDEMLAVGPPTTRSFLLEPTAFVPPLLLLACQAQRDIAEM